VFGAVSEQWSNFPLSSPPRQGRRDVSAPKSDAPVMVERLQTVVYLTEAEEVGIMMKTWLIISTYLFINQRALPAHVIGDSGTESKARRGFKGREYLSVGLTSSAWICATLTVPNAAKLR